MAVDPEVAPVLLAFCVDLVVFIVVAIDGYLTSGLY
jgi:hypothetical protein